MPEIVVAVAPDTAPAVRSGVPSHAAQEILDTARDLGVALYPMDPASNTPLASYFVIHVADPELAQEVTERFQQCKAVEAAYPKPIAELP